MLINITDDIVRLHKTGILDRLLCDKTTGRNILWATDAYAELGARYERNEEIAPELITGASLGVIKTRARKAFEQQTERTRHRAEVFTPLWVVRQMCDALDEAWFGYPDVFFKDGVPTEHVRFFENKRTWRDYVDSRRMEITCGEGPFLVSRYDAATGEVIPVAERVGILDRKLRVVSENAENEAEWLTWAFRAFQSSYGYEWAGDNLLIARVNLLTSFGECFQARWGHASQLRDEKKLANIIAWNIWQMDGLSYTVPYSHAPEDQISLFESEYRPPPLCRTFNWRARKNVELKGVGTEMKFDFIIGNPPYQESQDTNNKSEAIYHYFYDSVEEISNSYILISPARFLFNAGLTPKVWNKKMLSDEHLKVVSYFANSSDVFPNTNINGGVAIILRDADKIFGAIESFIPNDTLRKLAQHFRSEETPSLSSVMYGGRSDLKFNEQFLTEFPDTKAQILKTMQAKHPTITKLGPGEEYELKSSAFERTPYAFCDTEPTDSENYYIIIGLENGKRVQKWIKKQYLSPRFPNHNNIAKWKIYISKADGAAGQIGKPIPARIIGRPSVSGPNSSFVPTFISIGDFETEIEAKNAEKYLKTKFARSLIGILKVTQDITPEKCKYVPLQDFTPASDIDWSKSIPEIDQQLYRKYGLDQTEIDFIESHVKEMT